MVKSYSFPIAFCAYWTYFLLIQTKAPIRIHFQGSAVEAFHRLHQIGNILGARGFVAGVHCQLGKTDIGRKHTHVTQADATQSRTAGSTQTARHSSVRTRTLRRF